MIQKDTVGDYFECSKLTAFEVFSSIGVGVIVFFLITIPTMIRHFELTQAQTVLLDKVGHNTQKILSRLDSLSFTNTVVTFLFWGLIGILIYGLTTALVRFWQAGEEDKELASDEYVHPTGFSRRRFWKQIIEKEVFSAAILTAELIVICAAIFWAFPFGLMRVQVLFNGFGIIELLLVLLWTVIIAALFCLGLLIFKAWRYRHILFVV